MKLRGKVAIVTGGGSGIGAASCYAFAREGARVAVASRTLAKAEAVARAIASAGGRAIAISADVALSADVQGMVDRTASELGPPDIVFNNAGISPAGRVTDISEADWDACLDIDLKSVFLTAKAALPLMIEAGGGVVLNTAGSFRHPRRQEQSGLLGRQGRRHQSQSFHRARLRAGQYPLQRDLPGLCGYALECRLPARRTRGISGTVSAAAGDDRRGGCGGDGGISRFRRRQDDNGRGLRS